MKNHVKICAKDWTAFAKEEDYEKLRKAQVNKECVEFVDLFGALTSVDGARLIFVFQCSAATRARYEEFEQMIKEEEEAMKEEKPEWL